MKSLLQPLRWLALFAFASLLPAVASASTITYAYTYTFGDGNVISGTLDGTPIGSVVNNVSNVTILFNGVALSGPVFTSQFDGSSYLAGPIVSFDASLNNFVFSNSDLVGGDFGYDSLFGMLNASVYADTAFGISSLGFASQDWPTVASRWSLGEKTSPGGETVPDAGATLLYLGLALAILAGFRRRFLALGLAQLAR